MILLQIADFRFGIQSDRESALRQLMAANYTPFFRTETDGEELLFLLDADASLELPADEPLRTFDYALTDSPARLRIYGNRYLLTITHGPSGRTFSLEGVREADGRFRFASDLTRRGIAPPRHILDHLLVFALSLAALEQGFLLIHSSTVVCAGKAVLFLGESGTGKSTHSRLWLENLPDTSLLNDDGPALRVQADGSVTVYGTPWSGKTPCYRDVSYPLGAFVRICRAPYNRLSPRLSAIQALGATLPSCLPTLQQEDTLLDRVCANLSAVLRVAPVFRMECLPDADAARVCREGLRPVLG